MEDQDIIPARFCSDSIRAAQKSGVGAAPLFQQAVSLGLISQDSADSRTKQADRRAVQAIGYAYQNYGIDALRRGSRNDQTGLPAIFGDGSSVDENESHKTISEMAAVRRGVVHHG